MVVISMKRDASQEQIKFAIDYVKKYKGKGYSTDTMVGSERTVIGIIGDTSGLTGDDIARFKRLPGVEDAVLISKRVPYKLISREYSKLANGNKQGSTVVYVGKEDEHVNTVAIGGGQGLVYMVGPCSIEGEEQLNRITEQIMEVADKCGALKRIILRGGAYKPRSSGYSSQGLGEEGLEILKLIGERYHIPTVTEVRSESHVDIVAKYAHMLQTGTRNMYNQDLLEDVGIAGKPVLFKRHFGAGIGEWFSFADRIAQARNKDIVLCERGVLPVGKGSEEYERYSLEINAIPIAKKETIQPLCGDSAHGTGREYLVLPIARAAVAAGADSIMAEVHDRPWEAWSDADQQIHPNKLEELIKQCDYIYEGIYS